MEKLERMKMKSQDIPVIERDLLLLENQLPLIVLKELGYRSGIDFVSWQREFVTHTISGPKRAIYQLPYCCPINQCRHILEIAWVHLTEVEDVRRCSYTRYSHHSPIDLYRVGIRLRPNQKQCLNDVMFYAGCHAPSILCMYRVTCLLRPRRVVSC